MAAFIAFVGMWAAVFGWHALTNNGESERECLAARYAMVKGVSIEEAREWSYRRNALVYIDGKWEDVNIFLNADLVRRQYASQALPDCLPLGGGCTWALDDEFAWNRREKNV